MRLKRSAGYSNAWLGLHRDSGLGNFLNIQKRWGVMFDLKTMFNTQQVTKMATEWLLSKNSVSFLAENLVEENTQTFHFSETEHLQDGNTTDKKSSAFVALLKALLTFIVLTILNVVRKLRDKSGSLRGKFRNAATTITSLVRPPPFFSTSKVLTAVLSIAMLFATACDNGNEPDDVTTPPTTVETPTETPVEPIVKVNKELYFSESDGIQISFDTLNKYLAMDNIDTIFMVPQGAFFASGALGYHYFELARSNLLEPRTNLSPRIRGKGDFVTNPGHPSQAPEDSLWFVSKGWTVNKFYTR